MTALSWSFTQQISEGNGLFRKKCISYVELKNTRENIVAYVYNSRRVKNMLNSGRVKNTYVEQMKTELYMLSSLGGNWDKLQSPLKVMTNVVGKVMTWWPDDHM
jgi:hypothetical protein